VYGFVLCADHKAIKPSPYDEEGLDCKVV